MDLLNKVGLELEILYEVIKALATNFLSIARLWEDCTEGFVVPE